MKLILVAWIAIPSLAATAGAVGDGSAPWWAPVVNMGAIGCVLLWFMLRMEPRMKALEAAQDRSNRTDLLRLAASPHVIPELKEEAASIMREIDAAQAARERKK